MQSFDSASSIMTVIRDGLRDAPKPSATPTPFVNAVYSLFNEFAEDYKDEWTRIDENEHMYRGDHWYNMQNTAGNNLPMPTTPIITSTIENIKADLSDEYPEAVIVPDSYSDDSEVVAKVLTKVIQQDLDVCQFDREYDKLTHDVLVDGWGVTEIGHDPDANNGAGSSYQRHVINKNFLCDPQCIDMQDGRAVFKIDKRPKDWFAQHYPEHVEHMTGDEDLVDDTHDDFSAPTAAKTKQNYRLIEAWFRAYDPDTHKHQVHFVIVAGHQLLENSTVDRPDGYFRHGLFPFVITRLYPEKGSALGFGIVDLFKNAQRYSDKLDQILLTNAFRASRSRLFVQEGMADVDDVRDFNKEVVETKGPPSAVAHWQDTPALPSYIMTYIQIIRDSIKSESGANDQSRGQTSGGVTAASAITALQDASTKRSRMEGRAIHYGFKESVRMQLEVVREFSTLERKIAVTINGKQQVLPFDRNVMNRLLNDGNEMPIEYYVDIRTARQTKYSKLSHNELWLQMTKSLAGTVDPVIMLEGLESDDKETLLDNIRRAQAGGMMALQQQVTQLTQIAKQQEQELNAYRDAMQQAQSLVQQQADASAQQAQAQAQQVTPPSPASPAFDPAALAQLAG